MQITNEVKKILSHYDGELPGIKARLCQILMHGKLAGTGRMVILPVDQGFEHGPARSFAKNSEAYDPDYHFKLAIDAGLSAYAAPLGFLQAGIDKFAGQVPTILKLNSSNSLLPKNAYPDQAVTGSVKDALELGCVAVGLTIYPGSHRSLDMIEEAREIVREARMSGLAAVIWSYPRGEGLTKEGETSIDSCAYAAHIAALLGAHIIKVKPPTDHVASPEAEKVYMAENIPISSMKDRIAHVVQSCFAGRRLVVFSGGVAKSTQDILDEAKAIKAGGGNGSIIGRNSFQRPKTEALTLLQSVCEVYR